MRRWRCRNNDHRLSRSFVLHPPPLQPGGGVRFRMIGCDGPSTRLSTRAQFKRSAGLAGPFDENALTDLWFRRGRTAVMGRHHARYPPPNENRRKIARQRGGLEPLARPVVRPTRPGGMAAGSGIGRAHAPRLSATIIINGPEHRAIDSGDVAKRSASRCSLAAHSAVEVAAMSWHISARFISVQCAV